MASSTRFLQRLIFIALVSVWPAVLARYTPFIPLSFLFDWTPQGQSPPIPVSEQCEQLNIKWGRNSVTGPSPVAPYYLQIYTSKHTWPFFVPAGSGLDFAWQVPFAPGTQYQICMFDSLGNAGGCQAIYTVIEPRNLTTPTCPNVTRPNVLDVVAQVQNGRLSQYGWIPQCSDISVTPKNGTPPYTFTISPSLHPPYNITFNSTSNWTVSLSWTSPFFVSVLDSAGNAWANGPLHSGSGPDTACLSLTTDAPKKSFPKTIVASAVGSAVGGIILGFIITQLVQRWRAKSRREYTDDGSPPRIQPLSPSLPYGHLPLLDNTGPQYQIEPFTMGGDQNSMRNVQRVTSLTNGGDAPLSPTGFSDQDSQAGSQHPRQQVYVVHHDSGQMPVTVFTSGDAVVTELPPGYPGGSRALAPGSSVTGSSSQPSDDLEENPAERRRQPGATPRKGPLHS